MREFEVGGRTYRAEKLNAFQQLHVMRRISPLLVPVLQIAAFAQGGGLAESVKEQPDLLGPLLSLLATLPDEALEYVIGTCLGALKVQTNPGVFVPLWIAPAKRTIVEELNDIGHLLPLVVSVIQEDLGGFFTALPTFLASRTPDSQA